MTKALPDSLTFYGAVWDVDCQQVKQYLGEHEIDYVWKDIDRDPKAAAEVAKLSDGSNRIPLLVFPDGAVLIQPENAQLADHLGLPESPEKDYHDLIIVGAGPCGLSAAIYTTREEIKTLLFEKKVVGGLAGITDTIDNYPGFPDGVSGLKLAEDMERQAKRFGADFKVGADVQKIEDGGRYKKIFTSMGDHFAKSVLIATGSDYRRLGVPGEKERISRGVHYCATCDGPFFKGKTLIVVGGGNSAMQESVFLTKFATKIIMLVRGQELKGSEILIEKVKSMPAIEIHYNVTTNEVKGEFGKGMTIEGSSGSGKTVEYNADGIFVFIGLIPNTAFLKGSVDLDDRGFIVTGKTFETTMPGVYAAGDVRSGSTLQIASAVGEGVTAALMIREYLKEAG